MDLDVTPTPAQLTPSLQSADNVADMATIEEGKVAEENSQSSVEAVQPFRLLDLPPELRNRIFELLVVKTGYPLLPSACKHDFHPTAVQPPVTRVSKQIRAESLAMFYSLSEFEVHIHCSDFGYFISHMGILGTKNRKHIRNVRLVLMDPLRCGEGLLDFVRWCVTADDTGEMTLHPDLRKIKDPNAQDGVCTCNVDADENCNICITGWAVWEAIALASQISDDRQPSEQQIRRAFAEWVVEKDLECLCTVDLLESEYKSRCSRHVPIVGGIDVLFGCDESRG